MRKRANEAFKTKGLSEAMLVHTGYNDKWLQKNLRRIDEIVKEYKGRRKTHINWNEGGDFTGKLQGQAVQVSRIVIGFADGRAGEDVVELIEEHRSPGAGQIGLRVLVPAPGRSRHSQLLGGR